MLKFSKWQSETRTVKVGSAWIADPTQDLPEDLVRYLLVNIGNLPFHWQTITRSRIPFLEPRVQ